MIEQDMFGEGDEKYFKQYLESPLNYTGSKFRLLAALEKHYPKGVPLMYDLFCGGGSVTANSPFERVVANDVITPLVGFYGLLQTTPWDDLLDRIRGSYVRPEDKEGYLKLRDKFNQNQDPVDFFILCCSCQNNMMRFNTQFKFNQTWGNRHFSDRTETKLKGYHSRFFQNLSIKFINQQFDEVEIEDGSFCYIDPPYLITSAGYNTYWSKSHEERLYALIDKLDGRGIKLMMSNVSRHKGKANPHMDRLKKYEVIELDFDYDKVSRAGKTETTEILVINY